MNSLLGQKLTVVRSQTQVSRPVGACWEFFMMQLFRWLGRCEGISFLLLLGIAMPLKYVWGWPEAVRVVGMAHGILFIGYVALANYVAMELKWSAKVWALSLISAVLPLGTFIFEKKYLTPELTTK